MTRPLRIDFPGALHHVTNRGHYQQPLFLCDDDRLLFLQLLGETILKFGWSLHAYTLMSNHFHLLIESGEGNLSNGMKALQQKYAQSFNRRYERQGTLYQKRFHNVLVEKESHLLELARYIVLNPVRAGMVARPEDYQWSSYHATAGLGRPPAWQTTDWLLAQFAPSPAEASAAYRRFVDEGVGLERSPWADLRNGIYLGTAAWMEKMRAVVEDKERSMEHPREQRCIARPAIETVIESVAEVMELEVDEITHKRGGLARRLVAYLAAQEGLIRLCEIAHSLTLRSSGHISNLVRRARDEIRSYREVAAIAEQCLARLRPPARALH